MKHHTAKINSKSNRWFSHHLSKTAKASVFERLLCFLGGCISVLGFAPFKYWPLIIISLAYVLNCCSNKKPAASYKLGFYYGIGLFGFGCYWLYISLHHFGGAPLYLALPLVAMFVLVLGCIMGLYTYILQVFWPGDSNYKQLIIFPASWILWEALRSWVFSGFPWLLLGYSQTNSLLRGFAPLIGVYGLSALLCYLAGCIVCCFKKSTRNSHKLILIASAIALFIAGYILTTKHWSTKEKYLEASMVQGDISQTIKWSPSESNHIIQRYANMTASIKHSKLIIWPEAAIPIFPSFIPDFMQQLQDFALSNKLSLLVGAPTYNKIKKTYYNSFLLLGKTQGQYSKQHLVPFGEYFPLVFITRFFLQAIHLPMSAFTPGGKNQAALIAQDIPLASYICYEITFPQLALNLVKGRQLIVTVSDDSWFGNSIAPAQHLQMGVMQSIISRRYQLFSTNSGITAIINDQGKILKQAPPSRPAILSGRVYSKIHNTPIVNYGYTPLLCLALLLLIGGFIPHKKKRPLIK